jgi:tRNA(Arg) A34 adenosine deaminase TadA
MDRPAQPAVLHAMSGRSGSGPQPMAIALEEAAAAAGQGEVPVGAVIIDGATGAVIARAGNRMRTLNDPTAHAEMLAIRAAAAQLQTARLDACDLFVTLEPCAMCAAAIAFARIRRLVFGAYDPKGGGVEHGARVFAQPTCHHRPEVIGGVEEQRCQALLQAFFRARRPQV